MSGRILVTGASGFVGRRTLAPLAALGFEVHALSRTGTATGPAVWHAVDLLDPAAGAAVFDRVRPTHLLHCAWDVAHGAFWDAPQNAAWRRASLALMTAAVACGTGRIVGVGSVAEYAPQPPGGGALREEDPIGGSTAYGRAKAATFAAAATLCARAGVSFAWARLFHLHGEGEPAARLHPSVAADIAAGRVPVLRQPDAVRDYLPVEEAGRMLALLAAGDLTGPLNLGSGRPMRLAAIAAGLAASAGRQDLAAALSVATGPAADIQVPDLTRLRAAGLAPTDSQP